MKEKNSHTHIYIEREKNIYNIYKYILHVHTKNTLIYIYKFAVVMSTMKKNQITGIVIEDAILYRIDMENLCG